MIECGCVRKRNFDSFLRKLGVLECYFLTNDRSFSWRFNSNSHRSLRNPHDRHSDIFADQNAFTGFA